MRYQYSVKPVDLQKVEAECNSMGQQGWELASALPYSRSDCCNNSVPILVLIFKKPV
jgi:hypothetical protein